MGLLLVSHDLALVAGIADRLVVLADGRVAEAGPASALIGAPASSALRAIVDPLRRQPLPRPVVVGAPILQVEAVSRTYARPRWFAAAPPPALADVSLTLRPGETLAVIGESGSGKSTLARIILGLDRPDAGTVRIDGAMWHGTSAAMRRRIQAVFQDPAASFDPRQTAGRIVAEPLHLSDMPAAARVQRVTEVLAQVGLPADAADRLPAHFSGGQRQRIAIARALILKPAIIVLDEALSALDEALQAEIVDLLLGLQRDLGVAYLFISHDMRRVRGFADRVLVLAQGRVVEEGAVTQVLDQPRSAYTAALVAAAPDLALTAGTGTA
jgi:peptide/nickel transport system ATP-binding protein